nr:hypothetical protein StreXyl84_00770 [Streptomyces sp. Xyl84]
MNRDRSSPISASIGAARERPEPRHPAPSHVAAGAARSADIQGDVGRLRGRPASTTPCIRVSYARKIGRTAHSAEGKREDCLMIAKLLAKLSFTRNYGAYGAHDWGTHTGDERV